MNSAFRDQLLRMDARDQTVRGELAADGSLFKGYHPRMEAVHRENAAKLRDIVLRVGWPGEKLVGKDGAHAAWRIAQHSIGEPASCARAATFWTRRRSAATCRAGISR